MPSATVLEPQRGEITKPRPKAGWRRATLCDSVDRCAVMPAAQGFTLRQPAERGLGGQPMKRVTAFVATPRKKSTFNAVRQFLDNLKSLADVEYEIVALSDYRLGLCGGCKVCFSKGEEFCPQKDDRDVLIEKMMSSDGVVFATPNYSFQVSALMKMFLDRLGFVFHR